uniref:Uncharacterized protein n=2 Tax=Aegilops tauschii subsp. strangulata TaxID=200361 RepID=A0A453BUX0_AEGTS
MDLPDLNYTPPAEDGDEIDEGVRDEMDEDIGDEIVQHSPDLNGLDLGFFNSLQSLTDCLSLRTLQDLIKGVLDEFENYEVYKLNRVFLSLQACMVEILNHAGGNGYKIPHANKERLENLGMLPPRLTCPPEVYANALHNLGIMERVAC